jgi:sugar (pentulose or hexulose) kinase
VAAIGEQYQADDSRNIRGDLMQADIVLVGIDFGGTNIKAVAIDPKGRVLAAASIATSTIPDVDIELADHSFQGLSFPDTLVDAGLSLLHRIRNEVGSTPMSVAVSATGTALVAVDLNYKALVPCIGHWGVPNSELDAAIPMPQEEYARISGYPKAYYPPIFQLAWLVQHVPSFGQNIHRVMSISDYVAGCLCGVFATEPSTAAASGAWDHFAQDWSRKILKTAQLSEEWFLTPIASGTRLANIHLSFGLGKTVVSSGGHDYLCAGLTASTFEASDCLDVLGTFEMVAKFTSVDMWSVVNGQAAGQLLHDRHVLPNQVASTLESVSAGQFEWLKRILNVGDGSVPSTEEDVGVQATRGRYFKPILRSPLFSPQEERAALMGLDPDVGAKEVLRMGMEALAYVGARMIERLDGVVGNESTRIIVGGGSSRNRLFTQMKADMLNKPIFVHKDADLSTIGAALLAGVGVGVYRDHQEAAQIFRHRVEEVLPNSIRHFEYRQVFDAMVWG